MEHAKSDEKGGVGFEKDVQKFTDNAEGTISLKEFLEQVGRCGERVAGNTGKRVYTGVQGMIDESTTHEAITEIYDDLITARNPKGTYDTNAYEWLYGDADEDGIYPWRWTDETVRMLNVKIKKMMSDAWNPLLAKTQGADAWDIVQLTEHQPATSRLTSALGGLKEAYEDYVAFLHVNRDTSSVLPGARGHRQGGVGGDHWG